MVSIRPTYVLSAFIFLLSACGNDSAIDAPQAAAPTTIEPTALDYDAIEATFRERVATLSADDMEGRSPASPGEERAVAYLVETYKEAGLTSPPGLDYVQEVPLVGVTPSEASALSIRAATGSLEFEFGRDAMFWSKRLVEQNAIADSPLVYVGYGIVAPEYQWNDYEGLDVQGKTVVVLVNDPGFATRDDDLFNGYAMTYYGRWTYKYEEAARQGAAGAIIVHESEAAGYPWQVVAGSWNGEQFDLVAADRNMGRANIEGWISRGAAQQLFELAGMRYEDMRDKAAQRDFSPVALDLTASASVRSDIAESKSLNVIGYIPGSRYPDEYIVYSAHWDHLGMRPATELNLANPDETDRIFNGAKDNASGVAMMLGIADVFGAQSTPPERSIVFLAVTAEESGLLGSAWYGESPVFPLEKTAANLNLDSPTLLGPTSDITVIGFGSSELETILARHAAAQGRALVQEPTPEKGFFYRSDHFNFSKRGVPALYAKGGIEHREQGAQFGAAWEADYIANRYHKVADEYDENWDIRGVIEDLELYYRVGAELAFSRDWPAWNDGNEFKAIREASAAARR
ncbi:MAG: M28 family metallopeptidase [Pseudomonadota bacterium]